MTNSLHAISESKKVLLIDDSDSVRSATSEIIESLSGYEVVGSYASSLQGLAAIYSIQPDIAIIDISIPEMNGFEIVSQLRYDHKTPPNLSVIMLTRHIHSAYLDRLLKLGISAYIVKDYAAEEIPTAFGSIAKRELFISPSVHVANRGMDSTSN